MTRPVASDPTRVGPWLDSLARDYGAKSALIADEVEALPCSFHSLRDACAALAAGYAEKGLKAGDRLAIWLPNGPPWMIAHFAAAASGIATIPLNTWYRESELQHFLGVARPRAILLDTSFRDIDFLAVLKTALDRLKDWPGPEHIIDVNEASRSTNDSRLNTVSFKELMSRPPKPWETAKEPPFSIAFPTSGTTSAPKLALHHEAAVLEHAGRIVERAQWSEDDVLLSALPPCGAYGYTLLMAALTAGARAIQMPTFDIDRAVELIESEKVTVMAVTEPLVRALLDHPQATRDSLGSLRLVFSAGSTLKDVVVLAQEKFGFQLANVYGSSELLALAAFWDLDANIDTRAQAGGVLTNRTMQVRAAAPNGENLATGEAGELQFKGPIMMDGYLANDSASRSCKTEDGWFASGDLGIVDDPLTGQFRYLSRLDDALRIKGFLVDPAEIESKLLDHPAIAAVQVVGVPDGRGEALAVAFVLLKEGHAATPEQLRESCRTGMASYKIPAIIEILESFPMTRSANGDKIVKKQLRDTARMLVNSEN